MEKVESCGIDPSPRLGIGYGYDWLIIWQDIVSRIFKMFYENCTLHFFSLGLTCNNLIAQENPARLTL